MLHQEQCWIDSGKKDKNSNCYVAPTTVTEPLLTSPQERAQIQAEPANANGKAQLLTSPNIAYQFTLGLLQQMSAQHAAYREDGQDTTRPSEMT